MHQMDDAALLTPLWSAIAGCVLQHLLCSAVTGAYHRHTPDA